MTFAVVLLALLAAGTVARILALNSEIDSLSQASAKFLKIARSKPDSDSGGSTQVQDSQEAVIEYLWLKNAVDEKRESRTIWFGGTLILLTLLVIAVVSKAT